MAAYRLRKEAEGQELIKKIPEDLVDAAVERALNAMTSPNKRAALSLYYVLKNVGGTALLVLPRFSASLLRTRQNLLQRV